MWVVEITYGNVEIFILISNLVLHEKNIVHILLYIRV